MEYPKLNGREPVASAGRLQLWSEACSYVLIAAGLIAVIVLHLLPGLLAGLLVYQLIHLLAPLLARRLPSRRARVIALVVLSAVIVAVLTVLTVLGIAHFKADTADMARLYDKMMEITDQARAHLPPWADQYLPTDIDEMRATLGDWTHRHVTILQMAGRGAAHIVIGLILGAIIAVDAADPSYRRPLAEALIERLVHLAEAFRRIVFAQVKISLLNTLFTAVFLLAVLPLCGAHLPLAKTLVVLTFVVGLLPVIGNLISNTMIIVAALAVSLPVTVAAFAFLVLIHKLEYFLNARIVGGQIEAKAWELLLAMLFMEAAFGMPGVIAAPIYYAYVKRELRARGLV